MSSIVAKKISHFGNVFLRNISNSKRREISTPTFKNIVLVDGVRTPFLRSFTGFADMLPYELARLSLVGILNKTDLDKELVDYVVYGNAMGNDACKNIAKDAAAFAGFSDKIPAHTVNMSCISSIQSITSAMALIACGAYDVIIAGGAEVMSTHPINLNRKLGCLTYLLTKAVSMRERIQLLSTFKREYLTLEWETNEEFTTKESLGHSADRLGAAFSVTKEEQDEYSLRSHKLAKEAVEAGFLTDIMPIQIEGGKFVDKDNGIRKTTMNELAKLEPAYIKPNGSVTVGNSTPRSDGASACLIMSEVKSKELGLKPKAYLRNFIYTAQDPFDQALLGPAYATPKLLDKSGLSVDDIDTWETHEAFGSQVLANVKAMDSDWFAQNYLGRPKKVGFPDMNKLNNWGGSLSIGHPLAATGVRLVMHTANRLVREDGRFGVISACSAGGNGVAFLVERHPDATPN